MFVTFNRVSCLIVCVGVLPGMALAQGVVKKRQLPAADPFTGAPVIQVMPHSLGGSPPGSPPWVYKLRMTGEHDPHLEVLRTPPPYVIGIALAGLQRGVLAHLGLEPEVGVLITNVLDDTPAAEAGLKIHDILVAIDGDVVKAPEDVQKRIRDAGDKTLKLKLLRAGEGLELEVTPKKNPLASEAGELAERIEALRQQQAELTLQHAEMLRQLREKQMVAPQMKVVGPGVVVPSTQPLLESIEQLRKEIDGRFQRIEKRLDALEEDGAGEEESVPDESTETE